MVDEAVVADLHPGRGHLPYLVPGKQRAEQRGTRHWRGTGTGVPDGDVERRRRAHIPQYVQSGGEEVEVPVVERHRDDRRVRLLLLAPQRFGEPDEPVPRGRERAEL